MSSYEQQKRMWRIQGVRENALADGIELRASQPGLYAMVGWDAFGAVYVWDELTGKTTQVAPDGTIDPEAMPAPSKRGRPSKDGGASPNREVGFR